MKTTWQWTRAELAAHEKGMAKVRGLWQTLAQGIRDQAAEVGEPQAIANAALMVAQMLEQETVQALLVGALADMLDRERAEGAG